ncbi:MAG: GNAT family N-acetyltransferase [Acidimicrobiaceae bacterium]|nr:GNAT family N-acetyltransferase [Acidimicrobiaceae bacterium]
MDEPYPAELAGDVVLLDGTPASIRPIRPEDAAALVAFHEHLSAETVYRRFFGIHPHLTPREVERFTHVDYRDRLAIVAEIDHLLAAVARYDRLPGTDRAEVAFVVADAYQHHGLGTLLLTRLVAAARDRGVTSFEAETLERNRLMREVFRHAGFPCEEHDVDGVVVVTFPITPGP